MKKSLCCLFIATLLIQTVSAQVGIGTELPAATSILDVSSTESGVLLPRMTSAQRTAITDPANGLTVFDTDTQSYYFYNSTEASWESLSSSRLERDNYVLVKSQDDFPTASAGSITLDANTYYEINGVINLDASINLNGAYVAGLDATQDTLSRTSGNVFEGSGGSIRNITITGGGNAFSITSGTSFMLQNTIIAGMANVGTISGLGFVYSSNVQYINNPNGIVYADITTLALNNQAWQETNSGIYEKFEGNFDLIQKESGYSIANGTAVALDVSSNPTVGGGVIIGASFSGSSSTYVNKYTNLTVGHNFPEMWFVQAPGIPDEYDDIATGNIYYDGSLTSGYIQSVTDDTAFKLSGGTQSSNLLRFSAPGDNQLKYLGKQSRTFRINASLSVRGTDIDDIFYTFFIRKNGNETLTETNSIFYVSDFLNVSSISITGSVELGPDDYVEIWCKRLENSGSSNLVVFSQNLNIN